MRTVRAPKAQSVENTNVRVGSHGPILLAALRKRKKAYAKTERGTTKATTGEVPGGGSLQRAIRFRMGA